MNKPYIFDFESLIEIIASKITQLLLCELNERSVKTHYMNKKETCEYLKITNNTLDLWITQGFPIIKIGGVIRFSQHEIDNWLLEYRKKTHSLL